ncbi:hypothetical protein TNCV_3731941 [Trichonephila clavipes]|nr:hypothetical protein TNCV_3731941 [Trichonephila clavipes]
MPETRSRPKKKRFQQKAEFVPNSVVNPIEKEMCGSLRSKSPKKISSWEISELYTRAFGDGPRNFEPWSSDVDDT